MSGREPKEKYKTIENRFQILQIFDSDDDTLSEKEAEVHEYKIVVPPIVADAIHKFRNDHKRIGTSYDVSAKKLSHHQRRLLSKQRRNCSKLAALSIPMIPKILKRLNWYSMVF